MYNNKNSLKILHVINSLNIGGTEKSTLIYSNYLTHTFNWIGVFAPKGFYSHENIVEPDVKLIYTKKKFSVNPINILLKYLQLSRLIKLLNIDVIHYHHRICLPVICLIKFLHPQIDVYYSHHCSFDDFINYLLIADKFVAISQSSRFDLQRYGKKNISLINHGIRAPAFVKKNFKKEYLNIGFVGRFSEVKGIPIILNSFKALIEKGFIVNLIFRGEGKLANHIKKIISRYEMNERVFIEKPESDILRTFDNIDLLVSASTEIEGFGLVLIEAASIGIPVIASNISAHREIITNNINGLLFEPGNVMDLSKKIEKVLKDEKLYQSLSYKGYQNVAEKYSLELTATKYKKLYLDNS
jgi:glycosyltransferase involved in cell wall biosynthesis